MATLPKSNSQEQRSLAPSKARRTFATGTNVPAAKAKTHLLEILTTIDECGSEFVITKRGKAIAKLVPFAGHDLPDIVGSMRGTFKIKGDIVSPDPEIWDAMR